MFSTFFRTCQLNTIRARPLFSSSIRRYATATPPRRPPPSSNTVRKSAVPTTSPRSRPSNTNLNDIRKLRQVELAEQVYNDGDKVLYSAGSRLLAFRIQCYSLAALAVLGVSVNFLAKTTDPTELKKRGLSPYISGAYIVLGIFLMATATWAVNRSYGQIKAINLVKKIDTVFLEVTATGRVPFVKHRFMVRPYDMLVDNRYVYLRDMPAWMRSQKLDESSPSAVTASVMANTLRAISRLCYHIFRGFKQFFEQEGIISIDVLHTNAKAQQLKEALSIDAGGLYLPSKSKDGFVLFELATFKDPGR